MISHYPTLRALVVIAALAAGDFLSSAQTQEPSLSELVSTLNRDSNWQPAGSITLAFPTHHPQGLVKIADHYFLSSVETLERPIRFDSPQQGYDRSPGSGVGHLFKIAADGNLIADLQLGEGAMYHPGGIDFDGQYIWVSVAEYRPDSRSIVYKVDPDSLIAEEVFRFDDHLGGILRDPDTDRLHAVSWGSRRFYSWQGRDGHYLPDSDAMTINTSYYIDYQDCQWLRPGQMFCSGLNSYRSANDQTITLGGLDLIDLNSLQPILQLPVMKTTARGAILTRNPFYVEQENASDLLFHFVPEDNHSVLYRYRVN